MPITIRLLIANALLAFAGLASAAPVILDFEDTPYENDTFDFPFVHKGFVIDPGLSASMPAITGGPDKHLVICGWCTTGTEGISISSDLGLRFELTSMDISFFEDSEAGITPLTGTVTGHLASGATLTQAIVGGVMNFDSSWSKLASVDIEFDTNVASVPPYLAGAIDDIHVSEVPVPAAVWLFVSALGGLGWMRRRQTH